MSRMQPSSPSPSSSSSCCVVLAVVVFVTPPAAATSGAAPVRCRARRAQRDRSAAAPGGRRGPPRRPAGRSSGRPWPPSARPTLEPAAPSCAGAVRAARPRDHRRHPPPVLQPRHRHAHGRRPRPASALALHRLPLAAAGGGFGSKINVGKLDDIIGRHRAGQRASSTCPRAACGSREYPAEALPKAEKVYAARRARSAWRPASSRSTRSARTSAAACPTASRSQWFECPCHGSQYNRVGEKKGGPAPRGMDRFARHRRRGGNVIVDTGTDRPRARRSARTPPARRPRARTASRGGECTELMFAVATCERSPSSSCVVLVDRLGRLRRWSTCASAAARRSAPRSSWPPTASRTTTTRRSKARGSSACQLLGVLPARSSSPSACRSTGWSSRAARPAPSSRATTALRRVGRASCSPPTADGGFNCAGCHGGMKATGGVAAVHRHRPEHRRGAGRSPGTAPALNTVLYRFSEDEVRYILIYGRPFSPMSPWGIAGGGPMNDQQIDTSSPTSRASRSRARTA